MSLIDMAKGYQTPLTLVLVVFGPQILRRLIAYFSRPTRPSTRPIIPSRPPVSTRLKVVLALHSLYHLSHLLIPPFDIFSTPHLPILAPNDRVRTRLLPLGDTSTNPLLDLLLVRLQNLDNRLLYFRYGHDVLQGCLWCKTPLDYFIASLPDILGRYVWAAVVLISLGSETLGGQGAKWRARRWTSSGSWVLGLAFLGEIGARYLWDLRISNGDTLHLSHTIHYARTLLILLLPILHTLLPAGTPPPNPALLIASLQISQNTQRLTSLLRESVQQDDQLRNTWSHVGRVERAVKNAVRVDPEVQRTMRDYGIEPGSAGHARQWVEEGWSGLMRIHVDSEAR